MEKLKVLKETISALSVEELAEIKKYLESLVSEGENTEETEGNSNEDLSPNEDTVTEGKLDVVPNEQESESDETPTEEEKEKDNEETLNQDEVSDSSEKETSDEESQGNHESAEPNETDTEDIPIMEKGNLVRGEEEEEISAPDYEEIIKGLNAKVEEQAEELRRLRDKVEGAFGYSAKSPIPAKTNRLYDNCEDIHFHK